MDENTAIRVSNLSKYFVLPHQRKSTIKSLFVHPFKRYEVEKQKAFENVSFEIKKGEFFGIVGRNGSGKSTLLKCLAGVYAPEKGSIEIGGTLVPFIELGVGFNPELSGRDNVYLNGALLGFSRKQMSEMYNDIVAFAELKNFMDQKLKNYSSGMQVRLAFSIAIRAQGDILLLDEVLAVGDSAFQQKCFDYFDSIQEDNKTIILVTHSMGIIEKYCDRALFLEKGLIKKIGEGSVIARMYEEMFLDEEIEKRAEARKYSRDPTAESVYKDETVNVTRVDTQQNGKKTNEIEALKEFEVVVIFKSQRSVEKINVRMNIKNRRGQVVVATDIEDSLGLVSIDEGKSYKLTFTIANNLTNDLYSISPTFADISGRSEVGLMNKRPMHEFTIKGIDKYVDSITHPDIDIKLTKVKEK